MKIVLVHGGAASVSPELLQLKLADLRRAAAAGFRELSSQPEASNDPKNPRERTLDSVQKSVEVMEDSPYFNAGFGSSLTSAGTVENDAIIADGSTLDFGAICSTTRIRNPVAVARSTLEHSEHCVFSGEGAHRFAVEQKHKLVDNDTLVHQYAKDRLAEYRTFSNALLCDREDDESDHDTVGAVALDLSTGMTAAATSTGGITGKQPGRVGDSPIIGSGAYADNRLGAVSTTGHGEAIMKVCLARDVLTRYERLLNEGNHPQPMQKAVDEALDNMRERVDGYGGVIAVGVKGHVGVGFSTKHMPWAFVVGGVDGTKLPPGTCTSVAVPNNNDGSKTVVHYGYERGEHFTVTL